MLVHDFPTDAEGKAIPYGVYDMALQRGPGVSVGWDHDTPAFAVASIRHWWHQMGYGRLPRGHDPVSSPPMRAGATAIGLAPGSMSFSSWPTRPGLTIEVSHFPPGTSKWNKIEHRLFCHITAELARHSADDV